MAPVYDNRDLEPSSDDDSMEMLDVLSDLFNENIDSPDDSSASSFTDECSHLIVPRTCNDDFDNAIKNPGTNGGSELPTEGDPAEKVDTIFHSEDESSVDPLETRETSTMDPEQVNSIKSDEKGLVKDSIVFSTVNADSIDRCRTADDNCIGEKEIEVVSCSMNQSASVHDVDKKSEMENSVMNDDSEQPPEDDSAEKAGTIFTSEDGSPVEALEKRETCTKDPEFEYDHRLHSMHDGDKLKKLESLPDINPDLLLMFEQFMAFTKATQVNADGTEHNRSVVDNCVTRTSSSRRNVGPNPKIVQPKARPANARNTLKTALKFSSKNAEMFVKKEEVTKSTQIPQLGFSARLIYGNMDFVIHSLGCQMITDDKFVAKVRLNRENLLDDTRNFEHAAEVLLDQLRIDQVLLDEVTASRDKHRELFLTRLEQVIKQLFMDEGQVTTRIELMNYVEGSKLHEDLTYFELCRLVMSSKFLYNALQQHAKELEKVEQRASRREKLFHRFKFYVEDQSKHLLNRLDNLLREISEDHRKSSLTKAPAYLHTPLRTLSRKHLLLIRNNDLKLFTDMSSVLRADIFEKPLQDLAKRWVNQVKSIKDDHLNKAPQLTSIIYFFLCKSLEEVIVEITERTDHRAADLLKSSALGWYPIKKLILKSEDAFTNCLQREYNFIFRLLKHFEKMSDFGRKPFQYEMQLFKKGQSTSRGVFSVVKTAIARTGRVFGFKMPEPNPFGVPDEFYVWLCMLDDVLFHVLPDGCELGMFNDVFETYIQMIRDAKYDQMETVRIVTHSLARYIVQFCSHDGRTPQDGSLDMEILRKQMDILSFKTNQSVNSAKTFRDQVDVFNSFWKTRRDIIDQFPTKIDLPEVYLMQERLMDVMMIGLGKDVDEETRVAFFRTYNDFVIDLNEVAFDWYIKAIPEVDMQSVISLGKVELIDNKWKDTNNRTYRVLDPKNFAAYIATWTKNCDVPKHYIIEVIQTLLEYIGSQLQRIHWEDESAHCLSDTDQILSTNELIFAIRNSLLYLREQIDYVSFDLFYDERVKPFSSVLTSTTSRQDFSSRIQLIKESFWYIRKQNEISFEDALRLYDELNSAHDLQLLRESYSMYSMFFEEFMQLYVDEDYFERASLIAGKVKDQHLNPVHFKSWDDCFKQDQVPQILAGLGAVWSILVSEDVAKAGKYFNPHCIQILCVLRLLSVDKAERGIDKHLAQVLTGQGKSLVLGLLAALFALTGHRVRIACYSEYLAKRDKQDFLVFYEMFNVAGNVTYGTFDDLANEIISPTVDGQEIELRNLVSDLLFKDKAILPHKLVAADSSNDVLLMDEVDVFFTKEFYGNTYNPCCTPLIPGLDRIQEEIWKYVVAGYMDVENRIHQFIQCSEFEKRAEFLEFLERPHCYTLCNYGKTLKTYTNKELFDERVGLMIKDAKVVHSQPQSWMKYRLNSEGVITCNEQGVYVPHRFYGYKNVFNYFRLKKENFVTQVGWNKNYGYLNIGCGSLSYAMLPMNYPLIVGVSGTLSSLNQYEKDTIERLYNIKQTSVMPTFFGCSNLQFNKIVNFHHHTTKSSWKTNIFSQANKMITANRAVIIFFDTDVELNAFEAEYAGQLDRVNVLTENTEDKERFISEAGVAKTITLATRGMGRGVDYKSSVTVEKNGGVHVIQTFFSMDVKEETQIKGRTARKDNKGSYELIVCEEDLRSSALMSGLNCVTYAELDTSRKQISLDNNAEISKKIQDGMDAHENTMKYMRSFYKE